MNLFQSGNFTLHSGAISTWKVGCDNLTWPDWMTIAAIIQYNIEFRAVEGVPRGGLLMAEALQLYAQPERKDLGLLICDDVLSTGASMEEQRAGRDAMGVVLFAGGDKPAWVHALWQYALPDRKVRIRRGGQ